MAPPPTLPMTSPAASMAVAMLRAGRWGKEGAVEALEVAVGWPAVGSCCGVESEIM